MAVSTEGKALLTTFAKLRGKMQKMLDYRKEWS